MSASGNDERGGGAPRVDHAALAEGWDAVARARYRDELAPVVQLQCSHGLDALGLLNAGAASLVGVDISAEMIAQARAKAAAVGMEAWHRDREAARPRLLPGADYVDDRPRENAGFPADVAERALGSGRPPMPERAWRPGQVIDALLGVGLRPERFREHPDLFRDPFGRWPDELARRLPNSYSVLAGRE